MHSTGGSGSHAARSVGWPRVGWTLADGVRETRRGRREADPGNHGGHGRSGEICRDEKGGRTRFMKSVMVLMQRAGLGRR